MASSISSQILYLTRSVCQQS